MSFLASIVISSVSGARTRGIDSSIKQTMNNMRTQAQLYYENQTPFSYSSVCTSPVGLSTMITEVNRVGQSTGTCSDPSIGNGVTWAFVFPLKAGGFWCVDGTGVARSKNQAGASYGGMVTMIGVSNPALTTSGSPLKNNTFCN